MNTCAVGKSVSQHVCMVLTCASVNIYEDVLRHIMCDSTCDCEVLVSAHTCVNAHARGFQCRPMFALRVNANQWHSSFLRVSQKESRVHTCDHRDTRAL